MADSSFFPTTTTPSIGTNFLCECPCSLKWTEKYFTLGKILQLLHFPVLQEHVLVKSFIDTDDWLVVQTGL